ncbi:MAG: TIGR02266 family protein [Nitrospirota bacterium]
MHDEFEDFKKDFLSKDAKEPVQRKKFQCPHCKGILVEAYIEQNPFPEIPCPSCGSMLDTSSIEEVAMPSKDTRADKRCEMSLKVSYTSYNEFITEYTKNVSRGGMFINTRRKHEVGENVDLFLYVPGLDEPLRVGAMVVHINFHNVKDEDAGIGVKFVDIDNSSRHLLINFIKSREERL